MELADFIRDSKAPVRRNAASKSAVTASRQIRRPKNATTGQHAMMARRVRSLRHRSVRQSTKTTYVSRVMVMDAPRHAGTKYAATERNRRTKNVITAVYARTGPPVRRLQAAPHSSTARAPGTAARMILIVCAEAGVCRGIRVLSVRRRVMTAARRHARGSFAATECRIATDSITFRELQMMNNAMMAIPILLMHV